jgi:hypothetical protein
VIHRDDDGLLRIAVHDSFQTDFLSSHSSNNNSSPFRLLEMSNLRGLTGTRNNTGNNTRNTQNNSQTRMRRTGRYRLRVVFQKRSSCCGPVC